MPINKGRVRREPLDIVPGVARTYSERLCRELRRAREAQGISQEDAAKRAGTSQRVVSKLERGTVEDPSMHSLVSLGKVYGLTPNTIAKLAGWWFSKDVEDERVDYLLDFLNNPAVSDELRNQTLTLVYATVRAMDEQRKTGGLMPKLSEREVS